LTETAHRLDTPSTPTALTSLLCTAGLALTPMLMPDPSLAAGHTNPVVMERLIYTVVVEPDGSSTKILSATERIATELGASDYSETTFNYSTSRDTFRVHQAYTLTPQGKQIHVSENAIRHVDEVDDGRATMFTDSKDVVIVFPDTSVGARLVTVTEEHNHTPAYPGYFMQHFAAQDIHQVELTEYRIFVHPGVALKTFSHGLTKVDFTSLDPQTHPAQLALEQKAMEQGYRFQGYRFSNLKTRETEPDEADTGSTGARLLLTSIPDHQTLGRLYYSHARPKATPTADIQQTTQTIVAGLTTDHDRARAIYNWINQNIRYVAIYLGNGGLVPHPAQDIFRNRYGDCKDHVTLFETMLRIAGIESEPVLVNASQTYHLPPVALTYPFNHVITYIPSLQIYADPTAQFSPFGVLPYAVADKPVLHTITGQQAKTPVYAPASNSIRSVMSLKLHPNADIVGQLELQVSGSQEIYSRGLSFDRQDSNPDKVAQKIFAASREVGQGIIEHSDPRDMDRPFQLGSRFTLESHIDLPGPGAFAVPIGLRPTSLARRVIKKPVAKLVKPFRCEPELIEETTFLDMGHVIQVTRLPAPVDFESGHVSYRSRYQMLKTPTGQTLEVKRIMLTKPVSHVCPPQDHIHYQKLFDAMRADFRQQIFYESFAQDTP
jgi:transglutaminase-like putative cysteine protease